MDDVIATIDVHQLYPSIDTDDLILVVGDAVLAFYTSKGKRSTGLFIRALVAVVMRNQYISVRGCIFHGHGISTGVSPGVFLANIYLASTDDKLVAKFGSVLHFMKRFVDDAVLSGPRSVAHEVWNFLNTQDNNLEWEIADIGGTCVFLDLQLTIEDGLLRHDIYRKPLCNHMFHPGCSGHAPSHSKSLIHGEVVRIARNCDALCKALAASRFFHARLAERGHMIPFERLTDLYSLYMQRGPRSATAKTRSSVASLHLPYSSSVNTKVLNLSLKKFQYMQVAIRPTYTVQASLFRRLHPLNWGIYNTKD